MSFVCTRMSSVCHSYVLACHSYVIHLWFYHEPYIIPLINKKPDRIVLHIGINSILLYARENGWPNIGTKKIIFQKLPLCEIIISTPMLRKDKTTANKRYNLFVNHLKKRNIKLKLNNNIEKKYLNYRGLYLRKSGAITLSENLLKGIQSWCIENFCNISKRNNRKSFRNLEIVSKINFFPTSTLKTLKNIMIKWH